MSPDELLDYLLSEHESEFIEFKGNNHHADNIGELVSALANGAVLEKKDEAYLVFGVDDERNVIGTGFKPETKRAGSMPFKNWLATNLGNSDALSYFNVEHPNGHVVIIGIPRAKVYPVKFNGIEYIRVGESKKKLTEHPEIARRLWEEILRVSFEDGNASDLLNEDQVFDLLDFRPYYSLREVDYPGQRSTVIGHMVNAGVLVRKLGKFYITNLGALLFAKDMSSFDSLLNRGVRLIKYRGNDKTSVDRSADGHRGYAIGVNQLIDSAMLLLPSEEYLDGTTRKTRQVFPRAAIRELTSNMLMHQDFSITGYAPRIEIYSDRIEFTNPGSPVIEVSRFLDSNRSRNPKLASLMRQMKLCEERGMGIDIVEDSCAQKYLPSASINNSDGFTRVTIFDHKTLRQFSAADRINLVYMHCCLQHVKGLSTTNETLRSRFGDGVLSSTVASRWINEAVEAGVIKAYDPESSSRRHASYIPVWA
jgi:ATP-dependent DNA helicase RecG